MKLAKKFFLTGFILACMIFITIGILIWTSDGINYTLKKSYHASPADILNTYANMKYWPEWQNGIKSSRIFSQAGQKTVYRVQRLNDGMMFTDTIYQTWSGENSISIHIENELYTLDKIASANVLTDSTTLLTVSYDYYSESKFQNFLLYLINNSLNKESQESLDRLEAVIDQ